MQSTAFTRSIHTYTPLMYLGFFAIIVSYYFIVPKEWSSSDIVMKYGHTGLWILISMLLLARQKKFVVQHLHTLVAILLCGYVAFLAWFCVRAFSYIT